MTRDPTEMELRVARTLYDAITGDPRYCARIVAIDGKLISDASISPTKPMTPDFVEVARAAIQAMRDPTVQMMQATRTESVSHAVECYQAMIDAASPRVSP